MIRGNIKTLFKNVGSSRAARGSICNSTHKLIVRINNYIPIENLAKGDYVEIIGNIQFIGKYYHLFFLILSFLFYYIK